MCCFFYICLFDFLLFFFFLFFFAILFFFFFSSRRRHTRYIGDWSSDVCSSDLQTLRRFAFDPFYFGLLQRRGYRAHDSHSHLVLQGENIFQLSLESISPEMRAARCIDQLPDNAHPARRLAHATFKEVPHPQLATDLLHIHRSASVSEARVPRDDKQRSKPRQLGEDFFHDTIGEVFLFRVSAHVLKRQNGDGRLVWKKARCVGGHRRSEDP